MSSIDQRAIFEGMTRTLPVLAFVVDEQGVFREVIANGYTDDLLSEDPSSTIGKSIYELFATETAERFAENIDHALQTGVVQEFEYSLSIKGKTRIFAGYMAPMGSETDEELVIWIAEDITERKEHTRELERHEVFLESIREEVLVTDTDFLITYESAAVPKLYGYEQGERVGNSILQYVHPDDTERVRDHFEGQLTESGSTQLIEFRGKNKDGTWTWVESQARVLDDHPAIEGIVITSHDISERIEHRNKRQRQHNHLTGVEQLAQVGGWEYIPDTETMRWTQGTRRIFDVSDSYDPTLSDGINFYHETDRPRIEEAVENCLESGVPYSLDAQVITDEGRQRWVHVTGERRNEDGVTKLSGAIQDITQRKTKEQRQEVLTRVLRHNLSNELNIVQSYAELLLTENLSAEKQEYLSRIVTSADRLLSMAEKTRQFDEIVDQNYTTETVDLRTLLDDLCAEYRETYPDATIQTELSDVRVPGNYTGMKFIFEELIKNALEHNDATHPKVNIVAANPNTERLSVTVTDNGPGLPENEQQVIIEGEESALLHSNGIGLWTINWLVNEFSGNIRVTASEGEGTAITIKFPTAGSE